MDGLKIRLDKTEEKVSELKDSIKEVKIMQKCSREK